MKFLRIFAPIMAVTVPALAMPMDSAQRPAVVKPRALEQGGTIALVTPASPSNEYVLSFVTDSLESQGYTVKPAPNVLKRDGHTAGTDQERAQALMDAFADPEVDAIFCISGGYGVTRMLHLIDFDVIRENPKIFTGFSDITAMHMAIQRETGLVTFHSPTHSRTLGKTFEERPMQAEWFWRLIHADSYFDEDGNRIDGIDAYPTEDSEGEPETLVPGRAIGRLTGGNLSLIAALSGTPYDLDAEGAILFLEDVGEEPYRIDRMLSTLELSGKLDQLSGVVIGRFARSEPNNPDRTFTLEEVFERYFAHRDYPVISGFPTGHVVDNVTIPYGILAELDADNKTLRLLEDPVLLPTIGSTDDHE
ncbi:MAG: LD-carboxypeptidase [Candidatus Sumerlaeia bacterium]|nr:LD-carboxypeptidase [Candidatus Sumerlaeia bacterium]